MITKNARLLTFLNQLRKGRIHYRLDQHRDDAIMVEIAVPGERWEVEFLDDGTVEAEVFRSDGTIYDADSLDDLIAHHANARERGPSQKLAFDEAYLDRVSEALHIRLFPGKGAQKRAFVSPDGSLFVLGRVSAGTPRSNYTEYWFNVESQHVDILHRAAQAYVAFGCGSPDDMLLVPLSELEPHLSNLSVTRRRGFEQYNVRVLHQAEKFMLAELNSARVDWTRFRLPNARVSK
jgi:hypothetical protein